MTDSNDSDFLQQLFRLFQDEAAEHLTVVEQCIGELESTAGGDRSQALVEQTLREIHSLKGAARSVDVFVVEDICQTMESLLSAAKGGIVELDKRVINLFFRVLSHLQTLLENAAPGSTKRLSDSDKIVEEMKDAIAGVFLDSEQPAAKNADFKDPSARPDSTDHQAHAGPVYHEPDFQISYVPVGDSESSKKNTDDIKPNKQPDTPKPDTSTMSPAQPVVPKVDTVRVSMNRLDELLEIAEDLVTVKLDMNHIHQTVKQIYRSLDEWEDQLHHLKQQFSVLLTSRSNGSGNGSSQQDVSKLIQWHGDFSRKHKRDMRDLLAMTNLGSTESNQRIDTLFEQVKLVTMLPVSTAMQSFPRTVRELAQSQGKEIKYEIIGDETEIDRRILEEIKDPLLHAIRNAVDHGIETVEERKREGKPPTGTISVRITPLEGNQVEITVKDDGAGIDPNKALKAAIDNKLVTREEAREMNETQFVSFLFRSGVSTRKDVSEISGRGLGLAIVREKALSLNGDASITSYIGQGTELHITLPMSLATYRGLLVTCKGKPLIMPVTTVERVLRLSINEIKRLDKRRVIQIEDTIISLYSLAGLLGITGQKESNTGYKSEFIYVVVVQTSEARIAFEVDNIHGIQEVLARGLGPQLVRVRQISGAAMLADGTTVPILHMVSLVKLAVQQKNQNLTDDADKDRQSPRTNKILVVDDSITSRTLLRGILVAANFQVVTAVDGMDALEALRMDTFDVIVSDVDMPRMNGIELTRTVREDPELTKTPLILVTSLDAKEDIERGMDAGADAYIAKAAFDQSNLLETIKRFL